MEIINPIGLGDRPFGDIRPMGCGTDALLPPHAHDGGGGDEGCRFLVTGPCKGVLDPS